jgi:signal transduction histidine kinase
VSHELRTPLTVILGEADVTLRNRQAGADACREALGRIRDTARHANAIVDDLLLIARQEAARLRLDLTEVDLNQIAARTGELVGRPVALELPVVPARVRADPIRIRQCILALLQNAIRYGGSTITLSLVRSAGGWRVTVADDGPGMSDAEKAEAFERFFRGSNASAPEVDGTGLGLPIVRAIAEAHGGQAGLSDRPGGGLCAWFDLPADRGLALVSSGAA